MKKLDTALEQARRAAFKSGHAQTWLLVGNYNLLEDYHSSLKIEDYVAMRELNLGGNVMLQRGAQVFEKSDLFLEMNGLESHRCPELSDLLVTKTTTIYDIDSVGSGTRLGIASTKNVVREDQVY